MAPIAEATAGFIVRLSAAVRPRTLRLPLVLLPPGSMLMPSVRLTVEHMLQLKLVTFVHRHTFAMSGTTYGTVALTVNSSEVTTIGIPCARTPLETGLETSEVAREMITAATDTAVTALVVLAPARRMQLLMTQSRHMETTRQSSNTYIW